MFPSTTIANETWKWFKSCLGALDSTYVSVHVPASEKPKYRTRKGTISVNVLGFCNRDMNFIYALTEWEGSTADARVIHDAVTRDEEETDSPIHENEDDFIDNFESSEMWDVWRDNLAMLMYHN